MEIENIKKVITENNLNSVSDNKLRKMYDEIHINVIQNIIDKDTDDLVIKIRDFRKYWKDYKKCKHIKKLIGEELPNCECVKKAINLHFKKENDKINFLIIKLLLNNDGEC
jgi:hypothetical protein